MAPSSMAANSPYGPDGYEGYQRWVRAGGQGPLSSYLASLTRTVEPSAPSLNQEAPLAIIAAPSARADQLRLLADGLGGTSEQLAAAIASGQDPTSFALELSAGGSAAVRARQIAASPEAWRPENRLAQCETAAPAFTEADRAQLVVRGMIRPAARGAQTAACAWTCFSA